MYRTKTFRTAVALLAVIIVSIAFLWSGCEQAPQNAVSPTTTTTEKPAPLFSLAKHGQDIEKLAEIQKRHEDKILEHAAARGIGIGLDGEEIVFHVFVNRKAGKAEELPASLEGVKVKFIDTDDFEAFDGGPEHRAKMPPPVPAGVSTSNDEGCFAGTRGFLVYKGTQVGYITNNHVAAAGGRKLCPGTAPVGTIQFQPGTLDNGCSTSGISVIGQLDSFVPFKKKGNNTVDAAFVSSSTAQISAFILDIGDPTGVAVDPELGMTVKKSGRTTGLTTGTITTINATVNVSYGAGCGKFKFVNQFVVTPGSFSAAGDSGSPVVDSANNPVGLLFAGSSTVTICNPVQAVLAALGVGF